MARRHWLEGIGSRGGVMLADSLAGQHTVISLPLAALTLGRARDGTITELLCAKMPWDTIKAELNDLREAFYRRLEERGHTFIFTRIIQVGACA
jgi:hypothetical protein